MEFKPVETRARQYCSRGCRAKGQYKRTGKQDYQRRRARQMQQVQEMQELERHRQAVASL